MRRNFLTQRRAHLEEAIVLENRFLASINSIYCGKPVLLSLFHSFQADFASSHSARRGRLTPQNRNWCAKQSCSICVAGAAGCRWLAALLFACRMSSVVADRCPHRRCPPPSRSIERGSECVVVVVVVLVLVRSRLHAWVLNVCIRVRLLARRRFSPLDTIGLIGSTRGREFSSLRCNCFCFCFEFRAKREI